MPDFDIDLKVNVDDEDLERLKKELGDIDTDIGVDINTDDVDDVKKDLEALESDDIDISVSVDDTRVTEAKNKVEDIPSETSVNVDADSTQVREAHAEVDSIPSEVNVNVDVDDSQVKNARQEIDTMANGLNGIVGAMAGKSVWDLVYGTSAKAETNKVLIKNMGDTSESAKDLYNTVDKTTDGSLISMQQLIPALNGIKASTGASANEIDKASDKVANFGQYVYAMTGSSAKAETAMFDLSKGIKGLYASLDQYGITEDALMNTGLWSGKEDDLEGYLAAVEQVTGKTDEMMDTATGMEALMGKAFSRAGKRIGESVLPVVKSILGGFNELDSATDGWLSTAITVGGGVASSLVGGLSGISQARNGLKALKDSYKDVKDIIGSVTDGLKLLRDAEALETAAQEGSTFAKIASIFPTVSLAGAEMSLLWPILAVTVAIIALVAILWYLYNNNEQVRQGIDWLIATVKDFGAKLMIVGGIIVSFVTNSISQFGTFVTSGIQRIQSFVLTLQARINMVPLIIRKAFTDAYSRLIMIMNQWVSAGKSGGLRLVNSILNPLGSLAGRISSAMSGVAHALTKPFTDGWNKIKGYIDNIRNGINSITHISLGGADYEGVSYEGGLDTLNSSIARSNNNNNNTYAPTFNINGIIEDTASEYIVKSVNDYVAKENLIRGR